MSYGKNTVTSRGLVKRDFRRAMQIKILEAPPPEIAMLGDDPSDWESHGMPLDDSQIGKRYQVELSEAGKVIWREVCLPRKTYRGDKFYLTGTYNDWRMDYMLPDADIPHLH